MKYIDVLEIFRHKRDVTLNRLATVYGVAKLTVPKGKKSSLQDKRDSI